MNIDKFRNLLEVISIEKFNLLLTDFLSESESLNSSERIEILEILGEKYSKFYNSNLLDNHVKNKLSEILIRLTDFTNLTTMEDLGFILFSFKLNNYYLFLKNNAYSIQSNEVRNEVLNLLKEYESNSL